MTYIALKMRSNLETEEDPSPTTSSVVLLLLESSPVKEMESDHVIKPRL